MPKNDITYYLGIVEGNLMALGEDIYPVQFWHALKRIKEELGIVSIVEERTSPQDIINEENVKLAVRSSKRILEKKSTHKNSWGSLEDGLTIESGR